MSTTIRRRQDRYRTWRDDAPLRRALRGGDSGETTISLLMGLAIGSAILMGFLLFWLAARDSSTTTLESAKRQASGLVTLNRISDSVTEASAVVYADRNEIVVERRTGTNATATTLTRTRYVYDPAAQQIFTETVTGSVRDFAGGTNWGDTSDRKVIAERVRPPGDGGSVFRFALKNGTVLTDAQLPLTTPETAGVIRRVDVNYAAQAGKAAGFVELRTSSEVAIGAVGDSEPERPACPVPDWAEGHPNPIIRWDPVGETNEYRIYRDGNLIATVPHNDDADQYTYADYDVVSTPGAASRNYVVTAVGPGGESGVIPPATGPGTCRGIVWYPRITTPNVTAVMRPVTPEGYQWLTSPGSNYSQPTMELDWPAVATANFYRVYRRPLDNETFRPTANDWGNGIATLPASVINAGPEYTEQVAWDAAFEWKVVAYGPMPESSPGGPGYPALAHTSRPGSVTATPISPRVNEVTWQGEPGETAERIGVYRRETNGCNLGVTSNWHRIATIPVDQHTWYDNNVPLSTHVEYAVGADNEGPRGASRLDDTTVPSPTWYSSPLSSTDRALQWPAVPTTDARGSDLGNSNDANQASGVTGNTNRLNTIYAAPGPQGCASTVDQYRIDFYRHDGSGPVGSRTIAASANPTTVTHGPTIPRASRRYYKAVAINATGLSSNDTTTTGQDPAFQFPNNLSSSQPTASYSESTGSTGWLRYNPGGDSCRTRFVDDYETRYGDHDNNPSTPDQFYSVYVGTHQEWECNRYSASVTFSYSTNYDVMDNEAGGSRFCGGSARCTFSTEYTYNVPSYGAGTSTCSSNTSSCTVTFYSGRSTYPGSGSVSRSSQAPGGGGYYQRACNPGGCLDNRTPTATCESSGTCPLTPLAAPSFTVYGSEGPTSSGRNAMGVNTSLLGRNTIAWNPVEGASSYQVLWFNGATNPASTTGQTILASSGSACPSGSAYQLCFQHTGRARGTEEFYRVTAVRGAEVAGETSSKAGYQAPQATAINLQVTQQPTATDPRLRMTWQQAADAGEGAVGAGGRFCPPGRGTCSYRMQEIINNRVEGFTDYAYNENEYFARPPGGAELTMRMLVCNTGGCDFQETTVEPPACNFSMNEPAFDLVTERTLRSWGPQGRPSDQQFSDESRNGTIEVRWNAACGRNDAGITGYRVGRVPAGGGLSDDPHNRVWPNGFNPNNPNTGRFIPAGDPRTTGAIRSTPFANYDYYVWAIGQNGTMTLVDQADATKGYRVRATGGELIHSQSAIYCNNASIDRGFKMGFRFHRASRSAGRDISVDAVRYMWMARGFSDADWNTGEINAIADQLNNQMLANMDRSENYGDPDERWFDSTVGQTGPYTSGRLFWGGPSNRDANVGYTDPGVSTFTLVGPGGDPNARRMIPWRGRQGAPASYANGPVGQRYNRAGYAMGQILWSYKSPEGYNLDYGAGWPSQRYSDFDIVKSYNWTDGMSGANGGFPNQCSERAGNTQTVNGYLLRSQTGWLGQGSQAQRSSNDFSPATGYYQTYMNGSWYANR